MMNVLETPSHNLENRVTFIGGGESPKGVTMCDILHSDLPPLYFSQYLFVPDLFQYIVPHVNTPVFSPVGKERFIFTFCVL